MLEVWAGRFVAAITVSVWAKPGTPSWSRMRIPAPDKSRPNTHRTRFVSRKIEITRKEDRRDFTQSDLAWVKATSGPLMA